MAITNEDVLLIEQLTDCLSIKQIADKFDCKVSDIKQALKLKSGRVSKADRIRKLHADGYSRTECALIVGCNRALVCYALGPENSQPFISAGMQFGKLTVTGNAGATESRIKRYQCACECGKVHIARHDLLMAGKTRSCGCFKGRFRTAALYLVNHNKTFTPKPKGRPVKADLSSFAECRRLISQDGLTVMAAIKKTGLTVYSYYKQKNRSSKQQ